MSQSSSEYDRELMAAADELRAPFSEAIKEAWRRERLYRYLYWREHREHPPKNYTISWDSDDLKEEMERLRDFSRRKLDPQDVFDELAQLLESVYGSWSDALEEGTSLLLAKVNMPVWHAATGSLIPQSIGRLVIHDAVAYDDSRLGHSFNFGNRESGEKLTLILYNHGLDDLQDGLGDPRLEEHFRQAWSDILQTCNANGDRVLEETVIGPGVEELTDSVGRSTRTVGIAFDVAQPDGKERAEALSMCVFRGHFVKIRYTRFDQVEGDDSPQSIVAVNGDLAQFLCHYD